MIFGLTAADLANAFLLAVAGAVGMATVAATIKLASWLSKLDGEFDRSATSRAMIDSRLQEMNLRLSNVEGEVTENGGGSLKDAVKELKGAVADHLESSAQFGQLIADEGAKLQARVDRLEGNGKGI